MSSEIKAKTQLKQLRTGIHLVTITDAFLVKDNLGKPLKLPSGEVGLTIRFTNGKNFSFDNNYWIKGDREWIFKKMCAQAGINPANPKFKLESTGKRLWIYIKEVHDIDGDQYICDEITGLPVINYYIFDYSMCDNPQNKPIKAGDPDKNNGEASGEFIDYRQISPTEKYSRDNKENVSASDDFNLETAPKAVRLEKAKEIIGTTAPKSKTMQPNNEFSMEVGQHVELPKLKKEEQPLSEEDICAEEKVQTIGKEEVKVSIISEVEKWEV